MTNAGIGKTRFLAEFIYLSKSREAVDFFSLAIIG